jgi:hypothetical protein
MRQSGLVLLGLIAFAATGCGQSTLSAGTEKGPCYRNNTCNSGLICLSQLCVQLPEGGLPFEARVPLDARMSDLPPGQPPGQPWDGFVPGQPPGQPWDGFSPPKGDWGKKPPTKDGSPPKPVLDMMAADKTTKD